MAIDFDNPLTAGTVLIREAIQSQNYAPGASGWQVTSAGAAEFSDLTIRSSDGSGTTVTIQNGEITITDGAGNEVITIDAASYALYNTDGDLVAAIVLDANQPPDPTVGGFYARGFSSTQGPTDDTWAFLAGGLVAMSPVNTALVDTTGQLSYVCDSTAGYVKQILTTGTMDAATTNPARLQLLSEVGSRPEARIEGGTAGEEADLTVTGTVRAGNLRSGAAQVPSPGGTPGQTSVAVTFSSAMDSAPHVVATADSSSGNLDNSNIRWSVDAISATGFTIHCWRDTNAATDFQWIAVGQ